MKTSTPKSFRAALLRNYRIASTVCITDCPRGIVVHTQHREVLAEVEQLAKAAGLTVSYRHPGSNSFIVTR